MAEPFLAEVRIMSFGFAPRGWAQCFGQLMPINQNQALFSLLGTQFGGNGQTTFALPDFSARVPMHRGLGHTIGEAGGQASVTLTTAQMPAHSHLVSARSTPGQSNQPSPNASLAGSTPQNMWGAATSLQPMDGAMVGPAGGSQAHENRMPFLALNFAIALQGIYPSRN